MLSTLSPIAPHTSRMRLATGMCLGGHLVGSLHSLLVFFAHMIQAFRVSLEKSRMTWNCKG